MNLRVFARLAAGFCLLSILSLTCLYSQNILLPDSVVIGSKYKFVLYDDTEVIGRITARDSVYLSVKGEDEDYRIRKENIFYISRNFYRNNYKSVLSIGAGTSIFVPWYDSHNKWQPSYSVHTSAIFPIGENTGAQIEASFSRFTRDYPPYYNYYSPEMHFYSLKGNYVFGQIAPGENLMLYGSAGFGMDYVYEPAYETRYYSYYDTNYISYFNKSEGHVSGVLSLGAAIGYRLNNRFGLYLDVQFNSISYGAFFLFWGGRSYIPLRAGLTYTLF